MKPKQKMRESLNPSDPTGRESAKLLGKTAAAALVALGLTAGTIGAKANKSNIETVFTPKNEQNCEVTGHSDVETAKSGDTFAERYDNELDDLRAAGRYDDAKNLFEFAQENLKVVDSDGVEHPAELPPIEGREYRYATFDCDPKEQIGAGLINDAIHGSGKMQGLPVNDSSKYAQ